MIPTVDFHFPFGRYHATPYGHHVNEALVEWPPSPWRLLRAFISCGFYRLGWAAVPDTGVRLIDKLGSVLPAYALPPGTLGHTRHYMPGDVLRTGEDTTTLVFDGFADVGEGRLSVRWPVDLLDDEALLLGRLVGAITYLGRSESVVTADLDPGDGRPDDEYESTALGVGEEVSPGFEEVSVIAPLPPAVYSAWRGKHMSHAARHDSASAVGFSKLFPPTLIECLRQDTRTWKDAGISAPPGSRFVKYRRRSKALASGVATLAPRRHAVPVEMMLVAVTAPGGRRSALPPLRRSVPVAEALHQTFAANASYVPEADETVRLLVGKDANNGVAVGHRHAYVIPLDLDDDGRIDHILVRAADGLNAPSQRVVRSVKRLYSQSLGDYVRLAVVGSGRLDVLRSLKAPYEKEINKLLGKSREWSGVTPFVPPRFLKKYGKNSLEGQVKAEALAAGLPEPHVIVLPVSPRQERTQLMFRHFVRRRSKGKPQPPVDAGYLVRLAFSEPQRGPICLGYGSHFGLGRFAAFS